MVSQQPQHVKTETNPPRALSHEIGYVIPAKAGIQRKTASAAGGFLNFSLFTFSFSLIFPPAKPPPMVDPAPTQQYNALDKTV